MEFPLLLSGKISGLWYYIVTGRDNPQKQKGCIKMKNEMIYVIEMLQNRSAKPHAILPKALEELSLRELTAISETLTAGIRMEGKA